VSLLWVFIIETISSRKQAGGVVQTDEPFRNGAGNRSVSRSHRRGTFPSPRGADTPVIADAETLSVRSHRAMGTEFAVYLDAPDNVQAQACFDTVFDEIGRLELTFSRFLPASELSRLNRHAARGRPSPIPKSSVAFLRA